MNHEELGFSEQLHTMNAAPQIMAVKGAFPSAACLWTAEVKLYTEAPRSSSPDPRSGAALCSAPTEPGLN